MRSIRVASLAILALMVTNLARADERYVFDLAKHPTTDVTLPSAPGAISIVVINRLPGRTYLYAVSREWIPIPAIVLPPGATIATGVGAGDIACAALTAAYDKAKAALTDETMVPATIKTIDGLLKDMDYTICTDAMVRGPIINALVELRSSVFIGPVGVAQGQQLRITVQRVAADSDVPERTWTTILSTGSRGEWVTSYGASFIQRDDQRFFAVAGTGADAGTFIITRERADDKRELTFLPSIFFSWLPANGRGRNVTISPTAGIGATSNTVGFFAGGTVTFNINLGVTVGYVVANHSRLLGKYTEGQKLSENLTDSQFVRNALLPSPFVGVTFRFGSSPFSSNTPPAAPAAPPAPAPASTPAGRPGGENPATPAR
jgi:hypothetical protein